MEDPKEIKADPESIWVRSKLLVPVIAVTAATVILYMRFEFRMGSIEGAMQRDMLDRSSERQELRKSVDGVRDELRKVFVDSVATRQAQAWIEHFRVGNRAKYPDLFIPDLPR